MKTAPCNHYPAIPTASLQSLPQPRPSPVTRFGENVDVRNRGTLRMGRFAGSQTQPQAAPAVVRLWSEDQCHELSAHQARGIAAQLLAAAALADTQNSH